MANRRAQAIGRYIHTHYRGGGPREVRALMREAHKHVGSHHGGRSVHRNPRGGMGLGTILVYTGVGVAAYRWLNKKPIMPAKLTDPLGP